MIDKLKVYRIMKRYILSLLIIPILFGCEKMQSYENCGIYVNGQLECELKSAFAGGGTADPSKGSSNRLHIYEEYFSEGPDWRKVEERVLITGFYYKGKEYSSVGESVDVIRINGLSSIGDIRIPMNQGKYEGGNDVVTSVRILEYSLGKYDYQLNQKEDSRIKIKISLKGGQTISIIYSGLTPYDGYV